MEKKMKENLSNRIFVASMEKQLQDKDKLLLKIGNKLENLSRLKDNLLKCINFMFNNHTNLIDRKQKAKLKTIKTMI